jgi:hypothetical protein
MLRTIFGKNQDKSPQSAIYRGLMEHLNTGLRCYNLATDVKNYNLSSQSSGNVYDINFLDKLNSKQSVFRLCLHQSSDNETFTVSKETDSEVEALCNISNDLESIQNAARLIMKKLGVSLSNEQNVVDFYPGF